VTGLSIFMGYHLYIIQSLIDDSFYVGSAQNLEERILRHNQGRSKYTKAKRPWRIVYSEEHPDRSSAMKKEYAIKRRKSKDYITKLIEEFSSG
jgi:putative endonuclease